MSRRFQYSLRALLVAMLIVAAFFGGMAVQRQVTVAKRSGGPRSYPIFGPGELVVLPDGTSRVQIVVPAP